MTKCFTLDTHLELRAKRAGKSQCLSPPKKDEPYGHQAREKHVAYHNNRLTRADTDSQSRREGEKGERVICITLDIRLEFYDF